jgi:SAM-dependent methyltransferase
MQTNPIQRHYDEVIAPHYDRDPQSVIGDSLDRALAQIRKQQVKAADRKRLQVLDIGMGTGRFLEMLSARSRLPIQPFGLDLSAKMVEAAGLRIPDLVAVVDDAANLDIYFQSQSFDLIATHFVTGFVPLEVLAPKIWDRLGPDGYWSFIGGTKAGFPELRRKASAKNFKWLLRGKSIDVDEIVSNPADQEEVIGTLEQNGFAIRECETFSPALHFANFKEFMEFGYWGGWLTPFIEALGLHKARPMFRMLVNALVFPVEDHHSIEIVLAQKTSARLLS